MSPRSLSKVAPDGPVEAHGPIAEGRHRVEQAMEGRVMGAGTGSAQRPVGRDALRAAIQLCADCGSCRDLMESECRFFAELYRIDDDTSPERAFISEETARTLADACTYCGLCPCPQVPAMLSEGKRAYAEDEGIPLATRLLMDVPRLARVCGTFPRVAEAVQRSKAAKPLLEKIGGIHPDRTLPHFARESFFEWAARTGRTERQSDGRSAAYFAGCTVGYLFPEVGRAVVEVLEHNGVPVHVPPQECCGMPYLVEGDVAHARARVEANVEGLARVRAAGDDIVSSCPTCGFMLRILLKENAYYSDDYQRSVGGSETEFKVPNTGVGGAEHIVLRGSDYRGVLRDDGFFSGIPPLERIDLADGISDTGEYLARMLADGRLATDFGRVDLRVAYFPPCHTRRQQIGRPYVELLRLIPGLTVDVVGEGSCCGMGGNLGFTSRGHEPSLAVGQPLFDTMSKAAPDAIVTECLSCRLQFDFALQVPVLHPMEMFARAYRAAAAVGTAAD